MDRKNKIAVILLTVLLIFIAAGSNASQKDICSTAPAEYREICNKTNLWLDQKLVDWEPEHHRPMEFGAYHLFASDEMFEKSNAEIDMKVLDILEETGADTIVLYIRPETYFSQKDRYDALIDKIRTDGKKLFIGARFDDEKMTFEQYRDALTNYTRDIIAAIRPDYYGIVIEPATMEKKHGFDAKSNEWIGLARDISILSKQSSPKTKTVVAGHKEEFTFLNLASSIHYIDIIGINIYDNSGIHDNYSGYLGKGDVVGNAIDYARSNGKEIWILETWIADCSRSKDTQESCNMEFMEQIDTKWIRVMAYYAQTHDVKAIVPFFSGKFIYYGTDPQDFVSALDSKKRTPVFYEYRKLIEEISS